MKTVIRGQMMEMEISFFLMLLTSIPMKVGLM